MRLHELKCFKDILVVNNKTGNKAVLTAPGAVFDSFDTHDTRNISVAYAALFDDNWRVASSAESVDFHKKSTCPPSILKLVSDTTMKTHLKLVASN